MLPIVIKVLLVIHVLVSLLIILLVLMQRPKSEGLGAAFGGGATDQLFGAQTTNVLQTITRWLGGIFFALTLLLSILYVKQGGGRSAVQEKLSAPTVIPALPANLPTGDGAIVPDGAGALKLEQAPPTPGANDGKEPMLKLEQTPPKPGEGFSDPVKPDAPKPEMEKAPETPAPAPGKPPQKPESAPAPAPEKAPDAKPPAPPENKPAEPAPDPKPAEPAK